LGGLPRFHVKKDNGFNDVGFCGSGVGEVSGSAPKGTSRKPISRWRIEGAPGNVEVSRPLSLTASGRSPFFESGARTGEEGGGVGERRMGSGLEDAAAFDEFFNQLVGSAFEFLDRAIGHVEADRKHSIINFATAVELFLKARLFKEH
jgi:hypothetical protein